MEVTDKKIVIVNMSDTESVDDYHSFLIHHGDNLRGEIVNYNQWGFVTIEFHKRRD